MPEDAVYVGRPSKWGNPFAVNEKVGRDSELWPYIIRTLPDGDDRLPWSQLVIHDREVAVDAFGWWFIEQPPLMCSLAEIRSHDLACWCPLDQPCHADFLLELANSHD